MPELPEVETIKQELEKAVLGKKIIEVCVHHPTVIRQPSVNKFKKEWTGVSIKHILRKAKVLILELSNGKSLVIHLKMTGQLVYPGNGKNAPGPSRRRRKQSSFLLYIGFRIRGNVRRRRGSQNQRRFSDG